MAKARAQYDILNNRFPSKRAIRYLDTACIFDSRTSFDSCVNYQRMFSEAHDIKALGISLNAITLNWGIKDLLKLVNEKKCSIRLLFLDPDSKATEDREIAENLSKNSIKNITYSNIELAKKVKKHLGDLGNLFECRMYNDIPTLNMYIVNNSVILFQHYLIGIRGRECPVFVLRDEGRDSGLFATYKNIFEEIWLNAKEVACE